MPTILKVSFPFFTKILKSPQNHPRHFFRNVMPSYQSEASLGWLKKMTPTTRTHRQPSQQELAVKITIRKGIIWS
jgi:hypothetical protein